MRKCDAPLHGSVAERLQLLGDARLRHAGAFQPLAQGRECRHIDGHGDGQPGRALILPVDEQQPA